MRFFWGTMTLEQFRNQLLYLQERLKTQSGSKSNYNAALQYGLIEENENKIQFYFENAQIIKKCRSDFWFWATNFVQYNKKEYGKI